MEIREKLIALISEATKTEPEKLTEETNFINDLNLDSLDMVEMLMKLEDEFDIEIPETETDNLKTLGDVIKYLDKK